MKKFFSVLALMIAVSFTCQAQSDEEESQLFGYTRSVSEMKVLNVELSGKEIITKELVIENPTTKTMKIVGYIVPAGVSAMSMQSKIGDFEKGKVLLCIDPTIVDKVEDQEIIINVIYTDRKGKEEAGQLGYKIPASDK